jgi:hypothetical protein
MALDMLAKMACIMHRFDGIDVNGGCGRVSSRGLIIEMSSFLAKRGGIWDVPPILRFWEGCDHQDEPANNDEDCSHQPHWCILLPVVQILLLKLLYFLLTSGPCLWLACIAVLHLPTWSPPPVGQGQGPVACVQIPLGALHLC